VTGPSALAVLLWLCRHGYDQVGCIRSAEACPRDEVDALIIADTCNDNDLKLLMPVAGQARFGGAVICRLPSEGEAGREAVEKAGRRKSRSVMMEGRGPVPLRKAG
jgi:hypothetical protein